MTIENEIQSKFTDEYHKALVNLIYTHNFLIDKMNEKFKELDITRQQFNVLRILNGQFPKPVPIGIIKERMLDKMSDASRIVDRLEKKEFVSRESSDKDRRSVHVLITKKGRQLLSDFNPSVVSFNNMLKCLTETEVKKFNEMLDKIRTNHSLNIN